MTAMKNKTFKETVRLVTKANEKWAKEHDLFMPTPFNKPKPWFSKQFKLGWMWATAVYGIIALLVILYTR